MKKVIFLVVFVFVLSGCELFSKELVLYSPNTVLTDDNLISIQDDIGDYLAGIEEKGYKTIGIHDKNNHELEIVHDCADFCEEDHYGIYYKDVNDKEKCDELEGKSIHDPESNDFTGCIPSVVKGLWE